MQTIQRNEYDPICLGLPIPRRVNEISFDDYGFAVTSPLPVREGDCLCFGPCHTSQEWFLAPYGEDGEGVLSPVGFSDAVVHDSIGDEEKILCWTVPSGVFQIRFATLGRYEKHAVLTREFRLAYDGFDVKKIAPDFVEKGLRLMDFRVKEVQPAVTPVNWGHTFRSYPFEVRYWGPAGLRKELLKRYPEIGTLL